MNKENKTKSQQLCTRYDELMLIEDIKTVLTSDDNCRIKIACIESYFNVYEQMLPKKEGINEPD